MSGATMPKGPRAITKPPGEPPPPVRRYPPSLRLAGVAADLRDMLDDAEVDRNDLRGIAVRIEAIAKELEVKP